MSTENNNTENNTKNTTDSQTADTTTTSSSNDNNSNNSGNKSTIAIILSIIAIAMVAYNLFGGGSSNQAPASGPDAFYLQQAKDLGIKKKTFEKCLLDPKIEERVTQESNEATALGAQGTPFNVIQTPEGKLMALPGAYPYEAFEEVINRIIAGELTDADFENSPDPSLLTNFNPDVDYWEGEESSPITIYEWSDYECPYCARVHPTLKRVVENYPGQVKWVYRHLPLTSIHPQAKPAAEAALCIGQEKGNPGFWSFTDAIFADQGVLQ